MEQPWKKRSKPPRSGGVWRLKGGLRFENITTLPEQPNCDQRPASTTSATPAAPPSSSKTKNTPATSPSPLAPNTNTTTTTTTNWLDDCKHITRGQCSSQLQYHGYFGSLGGDVVGQRNGKIKSWRQTTDAFRFGVVFFLVYFNTCDGSLFQLQPWRWWWVVRRWCFFSGSAVWKSRASEVESLDLLH